MQRSVIGPQKKSQIWSSTPQLNALCQIQRNSVVLHQIPDGVCQIHQNSSVLEKILRTAGLSPRRIGPLLGVQFNAEHSPGSKGGECAENAIRA